MNFEPVDQKQLSTFFFSFSILIFVFFFLQSRFENLKTQKNIIENVNFFPIDYPTLRKKKFRTKVTWKF